MKSKLKIRANAIKNKKRVDQNNEILKKLKSNIE